MESAVNASSAATIALVEVAYGDRYILKPKEKPHSLHLFAYSFM